VFARNYKSTTEKLLMVAEFWVYTLQHFVEAIFSR